jgi:putative transposase
MIHYIADYHRRAHDGLGLLRTLSGVPNKLWADGIRKAKSRRPVDPDVLTRALGNFTFVTIQDGCVRWDNLVYAHPDLIVVAADARNRTAVAGVATTEYQAWRDPGDLEYIYLLDHHNDRVITVPVQSVDRWYAKGLRLYQHQMVMKYLREQGRDSRDFAGAFESFSGRLAEINKIRTTKKTRQALARFHARASKKFIRSRVVEVDHNDPSGAAHMELVKNATGIPEPSFFPSLKSYRTGSYELNEPATDPGDAGTDTKKSVKASPPTKKPKSVPQQEGASDETRSYDLDLSDDVDDISSLFNKKDEAE